MFNKKAKAEPIGQFNPMPAVENGRQFNATKELISPANIASAVAYVRPSSGGGFVYSIIAIAAVSRYRVVNNETNLFANRAILSCQCGPWSTAELGSRLQDHLTTYGGRLFCADTEAQAFLRRATKVSAIPIHSSAGIGAGSMTEDERAIVLAELDGTMARWILRMDDPEIRALVGEATAYDTRKPAGSRLIAWALAARGLDMPRGGVFRLNVRSR
jgi:hypothetical protein